jgi:hypothetical protein
VNRRVVSLVVSLFGGVCLSVGMSGCDPGFWYDLGQSLDPPTDNPPDPIDVVEVDAGATEDLGEVEGARFALTWGFTEDPSLPSATKFASCHGSPGTSDGDRGPSCDPYEGDTSCAEAHPILCFLPVGLPAPETSFEFGFYSGWTGGRLASSSPVVGTRLTSQSVADAICAEQFGDGFRMAEFHDGNGGWAFVGYADDESVNTSSRNWLRIDDQSANCWD